MARLFREAAKPSDIIIRFKHVQVVSFLHERLTRADLVMQLNAAMFEEVSEFLKLSLRLESSSSYEAGDNYGCLSADGLAAERPETVFWPPLDSARLSRQNYIRHVSRLKMKTEFQLRRMKSLLSTVDVSVAIVSVSRAPLCFPMLTTDWLHNS